MKYNEWRDELYNNLLSVSEAERRRVLDYYAEAYADRRDAGFSEREIIDDFGAPYDAARRILSDGAESEKTGDYGNNENLRARRDERRENYGLGGGGPDRRDERRENYGRNDYRNTDYAPKPAPQSDYGWVFVLLCVIFALPIFFVIMGLAIATVFLYVAPFTLLISGIATIGAGVSAIFADPMAGALTAFTGLIIFGIALILFPACIKLVQLVWTLFRKLFVWLRSLFYKRRATL